MPSTYPAETPELYARLNLDFNASSEEIKDQFKKMAFEWHPDRNFSADAAKQFKAIVEAYMVLSDSKAKNRYDSSNEIIKARKRVREQTKEELKKKVISESRFYSSMSEFYDKATKKKSDPLIVKEPLVKSLEYLIKLAQLEITRDD
ncbi:MAG: DnaJ domain-containing protein [Nanoarchaeota archaeon]|nr:DnaJ domain-containing protein [Nanoarchaeota archaeon]MBU1643799.1 DnaJ domain-containing protein [Nanoarchaeota archaeon]MBU1977336.1 DnaJ domain-containing protein [Nanoarchaeota archaeon]